MCSRSFRKIWLALLMIALGSAAPTEEKRKPAPPTAPSKKEDVPETDSSALYELGRKLFDDYAPPEVKNQFEYPTQDQWDEFVVRLQRSLSSASLEELSAFEPEARRAYTVFRLIPDYADYADWLAERLDMIEIARGATQAPKVKTKAPRSEVSPGARNEPGSAPPDEAPSSTVPYCDLWFARLRERPKPPRADEFIPMLKVIFAAEGLPAELAWLAEVESSLNPSAKSPAGARGLFQLMPATARAFGLSLLPTDERIQPGKSARAAARLLRALDERFNSWPLALAAYNAGEGRIAATLKKNQATTFAAIAEELPAETRMYVPKVLATISVRENVPLEKFAWNIGPVQRLRDIGLGD